uniref:Uncharacterized protein TCIL3000_11_8450 n=1 Tax=Trypanosoma congolense (strain IL3000) TaxID=1068625 RepID=G0V170_TRYCI|nr:unnamed protein product [Trypanosoma congolense IL3000]
MRRPGSVISLTSSIFSSIFRASSFPKYFHMWSAAFEGRVTKFMVDIGVGTIGPMLPSLTHEPSSQGAVLGIKPTDVVLFSVEGITTSDAGRSVQPPAVGNCVDVQIPFFSLGETVFFTLQRDTPRAGGIFPAFGAELWAEKVILEKTLLASMQHVNRSEWEQWKAEREYLGEIFAQESHGVPTPVTNIFDSLSGISLDL